MVAQLYILRCRAACSINFSADKLLQSILPPESDEALGQTIRKRPVDTDEEDFAINLFDRRTVQVDLVSLAYWLIPPSSVCSFLRARSLLHYDF